MSALVTVAETPEYVRRAERLLAPADRMDVIAGLVRILKATAEGKR